MTNSKFETDREKITAITEQEGAAIRNADMKQYEAILSEDAVFLPPGMPIVRGGELRNWLRAFVENNTVEWPKFVHGDIAISGDFAYHEYIYTMKVAPKSGGQPAVGFGKGLHILRRHSDGSWKIIRNIWNDRPADSGA